MANKQRGKAADLTPEQSHILRDRGTEFPGSSPLNYEKRTGNYYCAGCGALLFHSNKKYESGSGWPSFYDAVKGAVGQSQDRSRGMERTEIHCASCKGHLGHLFEDGPKPTGLRYCTNGLSLAFLPEE